MLVPKTSSLFLSRTSWLIMHADSRWCLSWTASQDIIKSRCIHTSFIMPLRVYCYIVMPFGLKNARTTYQHAMNTIFYEHIHKTVESYVDDMIVKSRNKSHHLADIKKVFDIMQARQLKMNKTKSFLRVASGKFLGFVMTSKGIHLHPKKIRAIQEMQPLRNLKELRGLQGRLAYIRRFIANLSGPLLTLYQVNEEGSLIHLG